MSEQKLTKPEIARVFSLYWDNPCIYGKTIRQGTIRAIALQRIGYQYCQLILTSVSDITDEHALQVAKMAGFNTVDLGKSIVMEHFKSNIFPVEGINWWAIFQYLISKGYAVRLWFGPDHWANGKTAIELGLAIDKDTIVNNPVEAKNENE